MAKRTVLKTAPDNVYPITLAEAKLQLKLETAFTDDDALITTIIDGMTAQAQDYTQRQFMRATYQYWLDSWRDVDPQVNTLTRNLSGPYVTIPKGPVIAVASIKYYDTSATLQTLDPSLYQVDSKSSPARIRFTGSLPDLADQLNAVVIEYDAGYGLASDNVAAQQAACPSQLKLWIKAHIGTFYQNRQTVIAGRLDNINEYVLNLLSPLRLFL